jgi:autotransporter-associated beta strand protein
MIAANNWKCLGMPRRLRIDTPLPSLSATTIRSRTWRKHLLVGTALVSAALIASDALAASSGGRGGDGTNDSDSGIYRYGGAGGTFGNAGGAGANGSGNFPASGGGGGAAAAGGAGGTGNNGLNPGGGAAGVNGIAQSPTGGNGGNGDSGEASGGGGGGGGNGIVFTTGGTESVAGATGGAGGNGGAFINQVGSGGGGGSGGYGIVVTGNAITLTTSGNVSGGTGGIGANGANVGAAGGYSGSGGGGGGGIYVAPGSSTINVISGIVSGATGGMGGSAAYPSYPSNGAGGIGIEFVGSSNVVNISAGATVQGGDGATNAAGGAGIVGSGLTITNLGTIAGGHTGGTGTLANAINFTGGANTLIMSDGTTTGTITGSITLAGTLTISPPTNANWTLSNDISGAGSLIKTGAGTLTFTGSAGYGGDTQITAGTIALSGTGSLGSSRIVLATGTVFDVSAVTGTASARALANTGVGAAGTVNLGANTLRLRGISDGSASFAGVILGTGGLTLESLTSNASKQTLTGINTYTGLTTITRGILALEGAGSIASSSGVVLASRGTFDISGLSGTGTTISTLGNTADGQTGAVILGDKTLTLANANNGFAGVISGNGGLTLAAGTQTLSGANTYLGATTVAGGTLSLTGPGTLGASAGAVTVSGGTLDLGTTTQIKNGLVKLTGGTIANGTLASNSNFDLQNGSVTAVLAGSGGVTKSTSGTVTLSSIGTYTGATAVNGGTLLVNGDISSSSALSINAGGTLGGAGIVGNTTLNGGTLAAGIGGNAMTVQGNLTFTAASNYMIEVSPAAAGRVNVTGTAALAGATVNANFAAGSYLSKQYTIVNATGGVSGTFGSQVNTNLPSNVTSKLSYDAKNAYLDLTLAYVPPTPDPTPGTPTPPAFGNGFSGNQNAVSNTLTNYFITNGGIPMAFAALTPAGLTQAAGETTAGVQQPGVTAATQFVGALSDPTVAGRGADAPAAMGFADEGAAMNAYASTGRKHSGSERDAYAMITKAVPRLASFVPHWSLWVSGFGGSQTTDGNAAAGTNTSTSRIAGAAVGADYWFSAQTVAGFALAGGATNYSVGNGGSGRSDLFQLGGFVRHNIGASYVTATAAYGWQSVSSERMVGAEQLRAKFDTNSYSARLEGGHRLVAPWLGGFGLTPYAAAQVTYLDLPAYAETAVAGTGVFALAFGAKGMTSPRTELGLRSDKSFAVNDAVLTLRGRAAWAHDYNTERSAAATFQSLPGASFVVNGARPAANAALTTAEAEWRFANGISVGATFEGEFSEVTRSYAGKGVVRYAW